MEDGAARTSGQVTIGLISDTHGLLRPEALAELRGCDSIVHAGDVGDPGILDRLADIAPVTVVRGNVDRGPHAAAWPETATLDVGAGSIFVIHDVATLALDPAAAGYTAVIYGHSHKPGVERRNGVWFVNPGSAGPRRFKLPISLAKMQLGNGGVEVRLIEIAAGAGAR